MLTEGPADDNLLSHVRSPTDDAPNNVNKGSRRQMGDQSCGQRQRLVLALVFNIVPPATSLAVAPEAPLEADELQHCLIHSVDVWDRRERNHKPF